MQWLMSRSRSRSSTELEAPVPTTRIAFYSSYIFRGTRLIKTCKMICFEHSVYSQSIKVLWLVMILLGIFSINMYFATGNRSQASEKNLNNLIKTAIQRIEMTLYFFLHRADLENTFPTSYYNRKSHQNVQGYSSFQKLEHHS